MDLPSNATNAARPSDLFGFRTMLRSLWDVSPSAACAPDADRPTAAATEDVELLKGWP